VIEFYTAIIAIFFDHEIRLLGVAEVSIKKGFKSHMFGEF
jgi:hypothetical protein